MRKAIKTSTGDAGQLGIPIDAQRDPQVLPGTAFRRPFLKWAGSKFQLLREIAEALPQGRRLIEPFAGSAVVSLNMNFLSYLICDANQAVIDCFHEIAAGPDRFVSAGRELFSVANNTPERFYEFRSEFNTTRDRFRKALLFVYLNRHCFNGLCRFNRKGEFNVPFGKYRAPGFPEEAIVYFAERAKLAEFRCQGFEVTMANAQKGDVVYCDPPYVPLSRTSNFTSYSTDDFGENQQRKLAEMARLLSRRGIPVVISNHDTELTRKLYHGAVLKFVDVQRYISCDSSNRGKAREVLAVFHAE